MLSRVEDRVSLIFADGTFGNLPQGNFRVYYRTSQNRSFAIQPDDLIGITVTIPYTSRNGVGETLTIDMELKYTVDNASVSETNESIKNNAPATYYTQNRMVTGEDYQVSPLAVSQEIIKVKSVNRTSSGISRYFDLIDSTGKYSSTNIYGNDGVIYKEDKDDVTSFNFTTRTDVEGIVENTITPLLQNTNISEIKEGNPHIKFPQSVVFRKELEYEKEILEGSHNGYLKKLILKFRSLMCRQIR